MNTTTLIILICAGVLFLIVGFIVIIRLNNGKRSKKLQASLKKLNQEKESLEKENKVFLPKEDESYTSANIENTAGLENVKSPTIEDYVQDEPAQEEIPSEISEDFKEEFNTVYNPMGNKSQEFKLKEDDFEAFMNEHSYSRKVFNKPLIEKIKKLPPDVRMLLLSNVFDRFDDEK